VRQAGPAGTQMDNWDTFLTFVITPKSGPLRKLVRLHDVRQALIADLPPGYLKRAHWLRAGQALVTAAETGKSRDVERASEAIVAALDEEGWLPPGVSRAPRSEPPRSERPRFEPPRFEPPPSVVRCSLSQSVGNVTRKLPAEPLWRRIDPVGTNRQSAEGEQRASASFTRGPKDLEQFVRDYLLFL
jgi:hypothetical protein